MLVELSSPTGSAGSQVRVCSSAARARLGARSVEVMLKTLEEALGERVWVKSQGRGPVSVLPTLQALEKGEEP